MSRIPGMRRLRFQLAAILAAAMVPAGVIAIFQALAIAQEGSRQSVALLEGEAYIAAAGERRVMIEVRESLRSTARRISSAQDPAQECVAATSSLLDQHDWITRVGVFGADGTTTCGLDVPVDVSSSVEWSEFKSIGDFILGAPRRGNQTGREIIPAYHPIEGTEPEFSAVVAGIDVEYLKEVAAPSIDGDLHGYPFALVGNDGSVVLIDDSTSREWLPNALPLILGLSPGTKRATARDGREYYYITNPLSDGQLWAVMGVPDPTFWNKVFSERSFFVLSPVLLWLIAVAVVFAAMDRLVTRHINDLSRIATRIGRGELDIRIRDFDNAPAEIHRLGEAVRLMAHNLMEREGRLRELLQSQRSLLLEVHHRVKNNLQMISSLVNMQLRRSANADESEALQIVQDRIHSLALVHQNLYATERLDHVALDELLRDLCAHLAASLSQEEQRIEFDFALDHVTVDAEVATPVSLFMTEALSNVFKHSASDGAESSTIRIALEGKDDGFRLVIENPTSAVGGLGGGLGLGSRLMKGFAAQLGGQATLTEDNGIFRVTLDAPLAGRSSGTDFKVRRTET